MLGFNLDLTGVSPEEWDALITGEEAKDGLTDEEAVPEASGTPVSETGDVWVLGEHKLLCGDANKAQYYGALLGRLVLGAASGDHACRHYFPPARH
jgi:hypothetical protein